MTEPEDLEEDLFADLYDGNDTNPATSTVVADSSAEKTTSSAAYQTNDVQNGTGPEDLNENPVNDVYQGQAAQGAQQAFQGRDFTQGIGVHTGDGTHATEAENQGTGIKEDGKMFIGGLNWETTDQSLKDYFSQFGEVQECTVMRDSTTGRSRGFGFLTFRDPKTVNTVMVKEHYLDGKIIDPKRAIPRDEQEKTSKIFVGGVSQEATEQDFKQFFMQFGRVVDATLMIDKDTGRPRGFGFVTFDSEAAVEATLSRPLEILGKPIEVKKAQPRGNLRDDDRGRRGRMDSQGMPPDNTQQQVGGQGAGGMPSGISPTMMAQYWQRMQQYFSIMQQQMAVAAAAQGQGMGAMNMAAMNPAMMQQMKQMQSPSPGPQGMANMQNMQNMMNPAMMQQMQQMQQMQNQGQQMGMGPAAAGYTGNRGGPGYNASEQLAFEQQKYEQQQARRVVDNRAYSPYQQGGPTSWEGMYDEVPQPNIPSGPQGRGGGAMGRGAIPSQGGNSPQPAGAAPANAPTGPKNAGRPGANYRGGGRGGGHRGFHPYSR